jgi:hypothetical protein
VKCLCISCRSMLLHQREAAGMARQSTGSTCQLRWRGIVWFGGTLLIHALHESEKGTRWERATI